MDLNKRCSTDHISISYLAQLSPKRLAAKRMKDMRSHMRRLTNKRGKTHSEIKLCWCKFLGKKMRYCLFEARGVDDFLFQGTSQQLVAQFGWELCWKSTKSNHFWSKVSKTWHNYDTLDEVLKTMLNIVDMVHKCYNFWRYSQLLTPLTMIIVLSGTTWAIWQ